LVFPDNTTADDSSSNRLQTAISQQIEVGSESLLALEDESSTSIDHQSDLKVADALHSSMLINKIPSMASSGGVVFFLHIPKTGGSTIRRNIETYDRINYIFAKNYSTYRETVPQVEDAIIHGTTNNTVLFYEIHATTAPSFHKLRKRLRRWKETAQTNNVPFFVFTVIREPVAYAFSHFNFFHIQKRNPTFEQCNATEEEFIRLTLYNPQCQFLFQGEPSMRAQKFKNVMIQKDECENVKNEAIELFDWIGTTEKLSNETFVLLERMLGLPKNHTWENQKVSKEIQDVYFGRENTTSTVLQWIEGNMSTFDLELYNMTVSLYRFDIMDFED
jgi:hypothetical protein